MMWKKKSLKYFVTMFGQNLMDLVLIDLSSNIDNGKYRSELDRLIFLKKSCLYKNCQNI